MKTICVYCGSSDKIDPAYREAAYQMGETLAQRGLQLVYGAGKTGLMGAVADGVIHAGGQVIGVLPEMFNLPQLAHRGLARLEIVGSMHERKARLIELADAFIAMPGGFGTFDELFEALTWAQIGLHNKPIGLLNARRYFDPLVAMVQHARTEGMIYAEHIEFLVCEETPSVLLDHLENYRPPAGVERWINRDD